MRDRAILFHYLRSWVDSRLSIRVNRFPVGGSSRGLSAFRLEMIAGGFENNRRPGKVVLLDQDMVGVEG